MNPMCIGKLGHTYCTYYLQAVVEIKHTQRTFFNTSLTFSMGVYDDYT